MSSFKELGLEGGILDAVRDLGFENPTPIQVQAIPILLSSNGDLIASAQTGTGKTAAFGLPAVYLTDPKNKQTQTLILCPTRELCIQISKDLVAYSKYHPGIGIVSVYGGANIQEQIKALSKNAQIVVATPGRAIDLIKRGKLKLGDIKRLILDEADEMLSMGFKEELDRILSETPDNKQTLLFSATISNDIRSITKKYMKQPAEIAAAKVNTGAENVEHHYYMVHSKDRYELLKRLADINPDIYGIIFCRTRRETGEIANKLIHDGYSADALHGEMTQAQRDEVMGRFRKQQLQILVATDVAARGLDVDDITHVINYKLPDTPEVYIHRSGRTGRAGKSGVSIAIIHTREGNRIKEIERNSSITFERKQVPGGREVCEAQLLSLIDKMVKVEVDEEQIGPFLPVIMEKLDGMSREQLIKHFVSAEFNRFLDYYRNAKDINVSASVKQDKRSVRERRQTTFSKMYIDLGHRNALNPNRLMGIINEALDSSDAEIGKIEILKKFSFFEIERSKAAQLVKALQNEEFEGVPFKVEVSEDISKGAKTSARPGPKRKHRAKKNRKKKDRKRDRKSKGFRGKK